MMNRKRKKRPRNVVYKICNIMDKIKFWMKIKPNKLVIVSGADTSHFQSLVQFLESVKLFESNSHLLIFDLGLTEKESCFLKESFPDIDYRVFDYSRYPSYFNITVNAGQYAWKPIIVSDVLDEFKSSVVWFDAGSVLTQPLFQIRKALRKFGYYSPIASFSQSIRKWTHPKTLDFLNCEESLLDEKQIAASVVAVKWDRPKVLKLIKKWKECALIKECIAPEGSSRDNHRQDQAVLTVLAYQYGFAQIIPQRFLGFKLHQDID